MTSVPLPPPLPPTVRPFVRADLSATVATLARAFDDDPVMTWIFPDDGMRRRRLPGFFAAALRGSSPRHWTAPRSPCAAGRCSAPRSGCRRERGGRRCCASSLRCPAWSFRLRSRLSVASVTYGALLRLHPERPHWYLSGIGTDPPVQGTGVGGELLRSRLARCDADRLPAYLESSKERNVPFYERHGFRVTGELTIPGGGPTLWLMWRNPAEEAG